MKFMEPVINAFRIARNVRVVLPNVQAVFQEVYYI